MQRLPASQEGSTLSPTEFPTFLERAPTIIFGRTGRELLILTCGASLAASIWQSSDGLHTGLLPTLLSVLLSLLPVLLSLPLAFVQIGRRPLEQWVVVWLTYLLAPKLYLALPEGQAANKTTTDTREQAPRSPAGGAETSSDPSDPYQPAAHHKARGES